MTCYGKLTSSVSQDTNSAKKSSKNATVAQLDDQTCPPPIPDFSWRPFSHLDLFSKWNHICGSCFSNFSFCLDAIFTSWICSQSHIVFVGAVFFICYQGNPHYAWKTNALNILSFTRSNWYHVNIFPFQASPVLKNYLKICSPRFLCWRSGGGCHNHWRGTTFLLLKVTMLHMIHLMASWWCRQYLEQDNYSLARRSRDPNLQATKQNLKSITSQGCRNKE